MIRFGPATVMFILVSFVGHVLIGTVDERSMRAMGETGSLIYIGALSVLFLGTWALYLVVVYADIQEQEANGAWVLVVFLLGPLGAIIYAASVHRSFGTIEASTPIRQLAAYWFSLWPPGIVLILAVVVVGFMVSPGLMKSPCDGGVETVSGPWILEDYDTNGQVPKSFGGGFAHNRLRLITRMDIRSVNITGPDGDEMYSQTFDDPDSTTTIASMAPGVRCQTFTVYLETADGRSGTAKLTGRLEEDYSHWENPDF